MRQIKNMNKQEAIKALSEFPKYQIWWNDDYSYSFIYDSGSGFWVRSYEETEYSPTKWRIYGGSYATIKGVYSPMGETFSKEQLESITYK